MTKAYCKSESVGAHIRAVFADAGRVTNNLMIRFLRRPPLANLRLLIFDLDGTLIDSRIDLANSVNAMLD